MLAISIALTLSGSAVLFLVSLLLHHRTPLVLEHDSEELKAMKTINLTFFGCHLRLSLKHLLSLLMIELSEITRYLNH